MQYSMQYLFSIFRTVYVASQISVRGIKDMMARERCSIASATTVLVTCAWIDQLPFNQRKEAPLPTHMTPTHQALISALSRCDDRQRTNCLALSTIVTPLPGACQYPLTFDRGRKLLSIACSHICTSDGMASACRVQAAPRQHPSSTCTPRTPDQSRRTTTMHQDRLFAIPSLGSELYVS